MEAEWFAEDEILHGTAQRKIDGAFFPASPAAVLRSSIFSEILAEVLGARPQEEDLLKIREAIQARRDIQNTPDLDEKVWNTFLETYTTTGSRGARGKRAKRYVIPFHPEIAKRIKPKESRNWGTWYRLLMTNEEPLQFNEALHEEFVSRLQTMEPSNLFEEIIIKAVRKIDFDSTEDSSTTPIRPYVDGCSVAFQKDLSAWLKERHESPSNWLQACQDLFCFHFMMYYIQLAINLRREFDAVAQREAQTFQREIRGIYFGLWSEQASQDRRFRHEWRRRGERGIEGDIYDSWGRLSVLQTIAEHTPESVAGPGKPALTLSEAIQLLPPEAKERVAEDMLSAMGYGESQDGENDLAELAGRYSRTVRQYYESKSKANQTPATMGVNVVRQLGDGQERSYWRQQRRIGPTLRLTRGSLRFFARLFRLQSQDGDESHFDRFIQYLMERGIQFDSISQSEALRELEEMGLIDRQSDSGEAVYVRAL